MAKKIQRANALSKQRIVEAAIAILDTEGEGALTFRSRPGHTVFTLLLPIEGRMDD